MSEQNRTLGSIRNLAVATLAVSAAMNMAFDAAPRSQEVRTVATYDADKEQVEGPLAPVEASRAIARGNAACTIVDIIDTHTSGVREGLENAEKTTRNELVVRLAVGQTLAGQRARSRYEDDDAVQWSWPKAQAHTVRRDRAGNYERRLPMPVRYKSSPFSPPLAISGLGSDATSIAVAKVYPRTDKYAHDGYAEISLPIITETTDPLSGNTYRNMGRTSCGYIVRANKDGRLTWQKAGTSSQSPSPRPNEYIEATCTRVPNPMTEGRLKTVCDKRVPRIPELDLTVY